MGAQEKHDGALTLVEAVETLSNIADLDWDREVGIAKDHDIVIQDEKVSYRTVHWLHRRDAKETVDMVKEIFRVVLKYLKNFYKNDYTLVTDNKTMEGIKTIMVLVGEAAKKIDKYTSPLKQKQIKSVTDLKEYKQLQEFYLRKISRTIDESVLSKWIFALTSKAWQQRKMHSPEKKSSATKHVFVDLESVKKDSEYELFFIRKEDGTRFFSPRLVRNIKLVCDFGNYFSQGKGIDPMLDLSIWKDREAQAYAKYILRSSQREIDIFCKEAFCFKDKELVAFVNKAIIALMLASDPHHLISGEAAKNCGEYFEDFQRFLRDALNLSDYQKLLAYPPKKTSRLDTSILKVMHSLCRGICCGNHSLQSQDSFISYLLEEAVQEQSPEHIEAAKRSGLLWSRLASDYAAMQKLLSRHPSGPLDIVLHVLEDGNYAAFDPYYQGNIPHALFSLSYKDKIISNLRIPSPTHQEFIQKAGIIPEFKGFLRACESADRKHLLINMQDRTSWKEAARVSALEELGKVEEFSKHFEVATLAKDTEFYHQMAPYHEDHQANRFKAHLKEHLKDELSGFYFPKGFAKNLAGWLDGILEATHKIFFSNKNVLTREARLDFLEIVYLFLTLKLIETTNPDSFSLSCKDGIDVSICSSIELFCFLKLLSKEEFSHDDYQFISTLAYAPSLLNRERILLPERFNRMLSVIRTVEAAKEDQGLNFTKIIQEAYKPYFSSGILGCKVYPDKL